ncbi:hypothetical protein [Bdellovibrio sp.]|uniref:hypothetical protein n=1 Tax=Bdellovibrio TaxID=958 RepID=UPI0032221D3A
MLSKRRLGFLWLLPLLLLNACAIFHTASKAELESQNLIGEWHSASGSRLNIYCSGALSYEINRYTPFLGETKSSCSACSVKEIQPDQLILGPVDGTFKISRWPYRDGDTIKMVAEGDTWLRESTKACQRD